MDEWYSLEIKTYITMYSSSQEIPEIVTQSGQYVSPTFHESSALIARICIEFCCPFLVLLRFDFPRHETKRRRPYCEWEKCNFLFGGVNRTSVFSFPPYLFKRDSLIRIKRTEHHIENIVSISSKCVSSAMMCPTYCVVYSRESARAWTIFSLSAETQLYDDRDVSIWPSWTSIRTTVFFFPFVSI